MQVLLAGATGLIVYLVSLLASAPAAVLVPRLAAQFEAVELRAPDGSLWDGRARELVVSGEPLGELAWQFRPLWLFLGRAAAHLELEGGPMLAKGIAGWDLLGRVGIDDARLTTEAATLMDQLGFLPLAVSGRMGLRIDALRLRQGWPARLEGDLRWEQAGFEWPGLENLGSLGIGLTTEDGQVVATVRDHSEGPVVLDGQVRFAAGGGYTAELTFRTQRDTPPGMIRWLRQLGEDRGEGVYAVSHEGTLGGLGR
jgi:hypothetical protein